MPHGLFWLDWLVQLASRRRRRRPGETPEMRQMRELIERPSTFAPRSTEYPSPPWKPDGEPTSIERQTAHRIAALRIIRQPWSSERQGGDR